LLAALEVSLETEQPVRAALPVVAKLHAAERTHRRDDRIRGGRLGHCWLHESEAGAIIADAVADVAANVEAGPGIKRRQQERRPFELHLTGIVHKARAERDGFGTSHRCGGGRRLPLCRLALRRKLIKPRVQRRILPFHFEAVDALTHLRVFFFQIFHRAEIRGLRQHAISTGNSKCNQRDNNTAKENLRHRPPPLSKLPCMFNLGRRF
jgi:hypothetical protein